MTAYSPKAVGMVLKPNVCSVAKVIVQRQQDTYGYELRWVVADVDCYLLFVNIKLVLKPLMSRSDKSTNWCSLDLDKH